MNIKPPLLIAVIFGALVVVSKVYLVTKLSGPRAFTKPQDNSAFFLDQPVPQPQRILKRELRPATI